MLYLTEGDYINAGLSALSIIPGADAFTKTGKASKVLGNGIVESGLKHLDNVADGIKKLVKKADDAIDLEKHLPKKLLTEEAETFAKKADKVADDVVEDAAKAIKGGSNTKTLFRGDRASVVPDDVFQNGFKPKGTHNDALLHTKSNTTAGNFVSTSGDKTIATEFAGKNGYVYVIQTDNYVDINSTYGAGAYFPEQMEFSIPGGIKPSEIVGAYKKQGGKIIGDFIPNPNFGGN